IASRIQVTDPVHGMYETQAEAVHIDVNAHRIRQENLRIAASRRWEAASDFSRRVDAGNAASASSGVARSHSLCMPASAITLPHCVKSRCTTWASSLGDEAITVYPWSASQAWACGSASACFAAACHCCTIGAGVPLGRKMPCQKVCLNPGTPASSTVGTFGRLGLRFGLVTPRSRTLPVSPSWRASGMMSNMTWTSPPRSAPVAGPLPLYGTCFILVPAMILNSSPKRCWVDPIPADPKKRSEPLDLAYSRNSGNVLAGTEG